MAPSDNAEMYQQCSISELITFIEDRAREPAPLGPNGGRLGKKKYADILHQLDRDATFDFMGLIPELREKVYIEALSQGDIALLRTCKLIHNEAHYILTETRTLHLEANLLYAVFPQLYPKPSYLVSQATNMQHPNGVSWSFCGRSIAAFQHIRTLELTLRIAEFIPLYTQGRQQRSRRFGTSHHGRKILQRVAKNCKKLKRVTVRIEYLGDHDKHLAFCWGPMRDAGLPSLLYPLADLPDDCELGFQGLSEETEAEFWRLADKGMKGIDAKGVGFT